MLAANLRRSCLFALVAAIAALQQPLSSSRRSFLQQQLVLPCAGIAATLASCAPTPAFADSDDLLEVYFGCGCFWHVQHEFVEAERNLLGRSDGELTSRTGYAGGRQLGPDGKVCYHNAGQIADYGRLGHAEVVNVKIPPSEFPEFVLEYCKLFSQEGYRPDQFGDRGPEYRNLVGLPGGVESQYAKQLVEISSKQGGDKLDFAKGKGDDPDRRALVFVMDTSEFPFHVAERYHQYHDGFNIGENYPLSYNNLADRQAKQGTLGTSDCPNGMLGLGALGL